jgi:hypothetical protein
MIAYFERFVIEMTLKEALEMSLPGQDVDETVAFFASQPRFVRQFNKIDSDEIRSELREYGAWDSDELKDAEQNRKRILWIAACNIREEKESKKKHA